MPVCKKAVTAMLKSVYVRKTVLIICAAAAIFAFYVMLKPLFARFTAKDNVLKSGTAEVCFVNTGQSDCVLIRTENSVVLIDSGEAGSKETVCSALKSRGVSKIDLAVATHPHSDHIGSMTAVFSEFTVERLLLPEIPEEYISEPLLYNEVIRAAENEEGCSVVYARPNLAFDLGEGAVLEVLSPDECYFDEINNWSVAAKFTFGKTEFLFTGDMEAKAEHDLIASEANLSCDVLKCGHHGSATSTTEELLDAAKPRYAVFLCGAGNVHGHPHQRVKSALKQRGIRVFRTDLDGTVTFITDGMNIFVNTEK